MRRAFIGFSTPIGYMYKNPAESTVNDGMSSPNPVLYGSMGLLTLYDELWFACRSLCPQSMRTLSYVKYLDVDTSKIDLSKSDFLEDIDAVVENIGETSKVNLNNMFNRGYGPGIISYTGGEFATDNHTHELSFGNIAFSGNPGLRQLVADIWILERYKNLKLDLTLNPLTVRYGLDSNVVSGLDRVRQLGLADKILTVGSLYDITGKNGPYHPCIEEIRFDPLLVDFRLWMDDKKNKFDNYDMDMLEKDVNAKIRELTRNSIRKYVDYKNMAETAVKLTKDELLGKVPGLSALSTITDAVSHNKQARDFRYSAFIALTRMTLSDRGARQR